MSQVKSSIIITTCNRAKLLKTRSLPSAITEYKLVDTYEVIVVDDGSTDDTEEVVRAYQQVVPNIVYVKHPTNRGISAARNTGIKHAKGKYIGFLDDDDALAKGFLVYTEAVLDHYEDKDLVIGGRLVVYPDGPKYYEAQDITPSTMYVALDDGFLARREVFEKIDYDESLDFNEDADTGIQFSQKIGVDRMVAMHNCLLVKFGHGIGDTDSVASATPKTCAGMLRYLEKNLAYYYQIGNREEIEYILRMAGIMFGQVGQMKKARIYFREARKILPTGRNLRLLCYSFLRKDLFRKLYRDYKTKDRRL